MTEESTHKTWIPFSDKIANEKVSLARLPLETLQINMGKLCNQSCTHCHVDAGPQKKRENMKRDTVDRLLILSSEYPHLKTVDITGGAPELNPNFRYLVSELRDQGKAIIDRCNLTVLFEPGQEDTAEFLKEKQVQITASLPCYTSDNVDQQRGDGVFSKSIKALQKLNELGYGKEEALKLDLVYNPGGPFLPPDQATLQAEYKKKLKDDFGISFNNLFTITNMPIKRFLFDLKRSKKYEIGRAHV